MFFFIQKGCNFVFSNQENIIHSKWYEKGDEDVLNWWYLGQFAKEWVNAE
jgi:hypothetical protein